MVHVDDASAGLSSAACKDIRRAFIRRAVEKFLDDGKNKGRFMLVPPEDYWDAAEAIKTLLPKYQALEKGGLAVMCGPGSAFGGLGTPRSIGKAIQHMDALCKKPDEIEDAWRRHLSLSQLVCGSCEYGWQEGDNTCPFHAQRKGPHKVRFYPLGFLGTTWYEGARRVVIDPGSDPASKTFTYLVSDLRKAANAPRHARWRSALLATAKDLEELHPELDRLPIPQIRPYFEAAGLPKHPSPRYREDWGLAKEEEEAEEAGSDIRYLLEAVNRVGRAALFLRRRQDDPDGDMLEVVVPRQANNCLREQRVILLSADIMWVILPTYHGLHPLHLYDVIEPTVGLVLRKAQQWLADHEATAETTRADVESDSKGITVQLWRSEMRELSPSELKAWFKRRPEAAALGPVEARGDAFFAERRADLGSFTVGHHAGAGGQTLERLIEAAEVLLDTGKEVSVTTLAETTGVPRRTVQSRLAEVADALGAHLVGKRKQRLEW